MKADALTLAATLNNAEVDFYTIPTYQRPYTWSQENYETLWDDLITAYDSHRKIIKKANKGKQNSEYYFLGPVVFVKNTLKKSLDIIDGQQRTTTFHVLLWYLWRLLKDDDEKQRIAQILMLFGKSEPRLKVSHRDASTYLLIRKSNDEIPGDSNLAAVANYFKDKVSELKEPKDFSKFLREHTQFIVIIADDYNRAWDLFIGLNGKGEPLNPTDLVKAFVCGNSDIGDQVGDIWEQKILPLGDDSTQFLLTLCRYKSKRFITESALFKNLTQLYPKQITIVNITKISDIFRLFWHTPIDDIQSEFPNGLKFSISGKRNLRLLRDLGRRDITPLIYFLSDLCGIDYIFDETLLKQLATYEIRMAIARKRVRDQKIVSLLSGLSLNKNHAQKTIEEIVKFLKSDAPDNETFEEYILIADYSSYPCRMILKYYEEGARGNKIINDFQIEHLMPQAGTTFWYRAAKTKDEDKYDSIINNIGNLFIIDSLTNNEIKNKPFNQKKRYYQKHLADWSLARITSNINGWTPKDIEKRAQDIATWARKHWKFV